MDKNVLMVVAHPDDETLWAGGTILSQPDWNWTILSLTRKSDPGRSKNFSKALSRFGAMGKMADLDDGPEQVPLTREEVQTTILSLLERKSYDIILTHHPKGEYTRHLRHEETSRAVLKLCQEKKVLTGEIWLFAYEDGGRAYYPRPIDENTSIFTLPEHIWKAKYNLIREIYGFSEDSWEAKTTPKKESFYILKSPEEALVFNT